MNMHLMERWPMGLCSLKYTAEEEEVRELEEIT